MFEDLKKEHKMARYSVILATVFLVLAFTSVASASMASGDFTKPTDPTLPDWFSATSGEVIIDLGGTGGIYLDPNAGPWKKQIVGIGVNPLLIHEFIPIAAAPGTIPPPPGGPPWTDWDELIDPLLNPVGWQWAANPAPTVTLSDDGIVVGIIKSINNPNDFVEFDFNPAEHPGATLTISKWIVWTGLPAQNPGMVWIDEYPTPEPSTIVLLISGLLALGLGYIRRRK
jgi:hypothetical protein